MESFPSPKKGRIPKACAACRGSKVRCDGGKPCTRCRNAKVHCDYVKPREDIVTEKLARIEQQMHTLSSRVPDASTAITLLQLQQQQEGRDVDMMSQSHSSPSDFRQQQNRNMTMSPQAYRPEYSQPPQTASPVSLPSSNPNPGAQQEIPFSPDFTLPNQTYQPLTPMKEKLSDFELRIEENLDVVARGLIRLEDAELYYETFFQGCDKYVPVFVPSIDTFTSVRARSSMLFDTMCAAGCRAELGPTSDQYQLLSNATKGPICAATLGTVPKTIETIQALLIDACYSEKGWLLTSLALRMALELNLPDAYTKLSLKILEDDGRRDRREEETLFRQARVWFGVFVLEHILSIDCGKKPGIKAGEGIRRCRVLLGHPARTTLDFRLLAQVELNSIRALAHERLSPGPGTSLSDQELSGIVQGTRIDLSIWLSDWLNLVDSHIKEDERASLVVNLRIQRDWSEMTMLCKGLQGIGIDNIAIMSDEQRNLIHLAKISAQRHLSIISNSKLYLGGLRYGMDFVWAKCAFSVLLLLKLARLLPDSTDMSQLISDAKTLLTELSKVPGSNNIYFRILSLSVEKCERALRGDFAQSTSRDSQGDGMARIDAEMDFQSYVPKEFILEWNFPGLTFCWIPLDFVELFMDFGSGF